VPGRSPGDGREVVEYGQLEGTLLREPRGSGGFGYDPVLQPAGLDRSCAELSSEEKNAISHRGHAFRALLPAIVEALAGS
jgi:XTP/dITP diphosphohydrolase